VHVVALVFFALAEPAQALPASEPLAGVVVDAFGKPAAGVVVLLSSGLPPTGERPLIGGVLWITGAAASTVVQNRAGPYAYRPGRALPDRGSR